MSGFLNIPSRECKEDYLAEFDWIAKMLLNDYQLVTPKNNYIIREIEFYYYSNIHQDCYCHKSPRQLTNSNLYFHRFKDHEKYQRLKQKGIDITIGDGKNCYGGILIRAIQNINSGDVFTGIGNITNLLIEEIGGTAMISRLYSMDNCIFNEDSSLRLKLTDNFKYKVYKKSRQGLNFKENDINKYYINAKYNYFSYPEIEYVL